MRSFNGDQGVLRFSPRLERMRTQKHGAFATACSPTIRSESCSQSGGFCRANPTQFSDDSATRL